ncbi:DNA-binding chaperone, partial [Reticulomyxa filosa]
METLVKQMTIEPVGHGFFVHYLRQLVYNARVRTSEGVNEEKQGDPNKKNVDQKKSGQKNKNKKSSGAQGSNQRELEINFEWDIKKDDLYGILGIKKYAMNCTCDEIKASYKKIQALCHPDKYTDEAKQKQAQERFQLLEHAYDTLSHEVYKKLYDSKTEFDDSIPNEIELQINGIDKTDFSSHKLIKSSEDRYSGTFSFFKKVYKDDELINEVVEAKCKVKDRKKFYDYFSSYFEKFSVYSNKKPVPMLGDDTMNDSKVSKFYKFWESFGSWRDFTHLCDPIDIYDLTYAENNTEWKWMKKHNDKKQEKYKLQEKM